MDKAVSNKAISAEQPSLRFPLALLMFSRVSACFTAPPAVRFGACAELSATR